MFVGSIFCSNVTFVQYYKIIKYCPIYVLLFMIIFFIDLVVRSTSDS